MPGPARAGAIVYAKQLDALSRFYQAVLGMQPLLQDDTHHVIENADAQLLIHAIPAGIASTIEITVPPALREDQAIKLFFTVPSLSQAAAVAEPLGGGVFGPTYEVLGLHLRNAYDPEGNIFQLRAPAL